jgi:hypothetical protein
MFIAGGNHFYTDSIMTSPDGITWTIRSNPMDGTRAVTPWGLVAHPTTALVLATGVSAGHCIISSTDGISWTTRYTSGSGQCLAYSPTLDLFIGVGAWGSSNNCLTSPDGITWTPSIAPFGTAYGIDWSESLGLFIVSRSNGTIYTSPDAVNWTLKSFSGFSGTVEYVLATA